MQACPVKNNDYLHVEKKIGVDEALRLFDEYKHLKNPERSMRNALDPEKHPTSEIKEKLEKIGRSLGDAITTEVREDGEPNRFYMADGKTYTSINDILDEIDELFFTGTSLGDFIPKLGTQIHDVFKAIAKEGLNTTAIVDRYPNLPEKFVGRAVKWVNDLKERENAVLLSESPIGGQFGKRNIAGTPDLVLLKDDGTIQIYDFKTVHQLSPDAQASWNVEAGSYKAKRYSTQLMAYGELIKSALGIPVTGYKVVPIEVDYDQPGSELSKVSDIRILDEESITTYGYIDGARRHLDRLMGKKQVAARTGIKTATDKSDELVSAIIGLEKPEWTDLKAKQHRAKQIIVDSNEKEDAKHKAYWHPARKQWIPYKSKDKGERINQIVREVVDAETKGKTDLYLSNKNFIRYGEDPLTDAAAEVVPKLFAEYRNTGFDITDLVALPGYEAKEHWMMLTRGNRLDLQYSGVEHMKSPLGNGESNLFGKINRFAKDKFGDIQAITGELKSLEGTIMALQLLKANPDKNLGRINIYTEAASGFPMVINPIRMYDMLKRVAEFVDTPKEIREPLKDLIDSVPRERLSQNYIQAYLDLLTDIRTFEPEKDDTPLSQKDKMAIKRRNKLKVLFADYVSHKDMALNDRAELKAKIKEQVLSHVFNLSQTKDRTEEQTREMQVLSFAYLQLNGIDTYDVSISNKLERDFQSRVHLEGNIIDFLNENLNAQKVKARKEFMRIHENKNIPMFNKLLKTSAGYSDWNPAVRTLSFTSKYFKPLMEQQTFYDDKSQTEFQGFTMRLVREGSAAYEALTPDQKEFHKEFRKQIKEVAKLAGHDKKDGFDDHNIPLMQNSLANSIFKGVDGTGSIKEVIPQWWDQLMDNKEFLNMENPHQKTGATQVNFAVDDWFASQQDEQNRNNSMGMFGVNTVADRSKFQSFETNLEKVMLAYLSNALRVKTMKQISGQFAVAHTAYNFYQNNLFGDSFAHNEKWIQSMTTTQIHGRDTDSGTFLNRLANLSSRIGSFITLAGNLKAGAIVALGQEILAFSRSISNSWVGNTQMYDAESYRKASNFIMSKKKRRLAAAIMDSYAIQDSDSTALRSDLYETTNKSFFRSKWFYALFRLGDRMSKGHILMATMIKDGSINAYSLDSEGNLVYNEDDDPRFQGEEGQALKEAIVDNLAPHGLITEDGRLKQGYDMKMVSKVHTELATLYGGMDRDMRAMFSFSAGGKVFFMHKHFYPSVFARALARRGEFDAFGSWKIIEDEDGKKKAVWTKGTHEGIFRSLYGVLTKLGKMRNMSDLKENMTEIEKTNMKRMMTDTMILMTFLGLSAAIGAADDDENPETAKFISDLAWGSLSDLLMVYNVRTFEQAFNPIAINVVYTSVERLLKALGRDVENEDYWSGVGESAVRTPAISRFAYDSYKIIEELTED